MLQFGDLDAFFGTTLGLSEQDLQTAVAEADDCEAAIQAELNLIPAPESVSAPTYFLMLVLIASLDSSRWPRNMSSPN